MCSLTRNSCGWLKIVCSCSVEFSEVRNVRRFAPGANLHYAFSNYLETRTPNVNKLYKKRAFES